MTDKPVSDDKARRILQRAAEIDRSDSMSIANLRDAAREAGISEAAFEAALREQAEEQNAPVAQRRSGRWVVRALAIIGATLLLFILYALSRRMVP